MRFVGNHFARNTFLIRTFLMSKPIFLWSRNPMMPFIFTSDLDLARLWPLQSHGLFYLFSCLRIGAKVLVFIGFALNTLFGYAIRHQVPVHLHTLQKKCSLKFIINSVTISVNYVKQTWYIWLTDWLLPSPILIVPSRMLQFS